MQHDTDKRRKVAQSPRKTDRQPQNPTEESETEDDTDGECYAINPKLEPRPDIPDAPKPIGPHVLDKVKKIYIPNPVNRFLRPYQRDGVQFMYKCYKEGRGGCLGDDMGLGKTIQVISFLSAIMGKTGTARDRYRRRDYVSELQDRPDWRTNMPRADAKWPTALIVVPTSTVANWEREVNKWGHFELGVYTSQLNKDERAGMLRDFKLGRLDTMIVSHNMLRTDIDSFDDLAISCVFLDEAHVIKRADAGLTQAVNRFKCMRRFALTGTLIQNSYMEMHPVLDWTNPGALGSRAQWKSTIVKPLVVGQSASATAEQRMKQDEIAEILNKVILPRFFLRRTKFLIKEQLPQKIVQAVFCPLAPIQREVYKRILALPEVQDLIMKEDPCPCGSRIARKKCCHPFQPENLFVYMHHLISCANHVALLLPGPNDTPEQIERYADLNKRVMKDIYADEGRRYKLTYSLAILQRDMCGKLDQWHKEGSNKVLIFTKSLKLMEVLEFHMKRDSYDFRKLDGSVPQKHRQKYIDEFNEQPEVYCFLISTLAGGTGINLTAANKVVIFGSAFRYGQTRDVYVYRLLGGGSLEELVYARQLYKQQQMAIGYDASAQTRYFTGVQGDPQKQGELFGIKNMFTYHEDEQTTKMAIERATIADLDFNLAKGSASGSTAKKGKDGKKLLGKEEAADLRGLGAFMFDELSPKKKQKAPQTAEQRILSEGGVTYTHRNDELIKGAPRKSVASAGPSKAPVAKKPRASTSKAKATNTLQSDPNWPPRRGKVFREAKAAALAAGVPYVPPPKGQLPTMPVGPPKGATPPEAATPRTSPSKSPTPPKPAKDNRTYKQRLVLSHISWRVCR
ncbi:P-loop containing nucleoside triphosphate hydrolase protein [Schizophyllum commune]